MHDTNFMQVCDLCDEEFQFGRGIYHGQHIPTYGITVCNTCYASNADGWNPQYDDFLRNRVEELKLQMPKKNEKGYYPRGK